MGWFDSFLNPGKGYAKGQEQLDKYYQQAQGQLNPYNQNGVQAGQGLNTAMNNLLDPAALQNKWSSGYQESPYAQQLQNQAQSQGMDAASAMGLMGSSPALNAIQQGSAGIMNADRQQYMNDLMQKYLAGTGIGQSMYGVGANAANQQSQNAMNQGQNSAGMAFGQQNAQGDLLSKGIGAAAGAFGGPIAGAAGNYLANKWFTGGK